MVWVKKGRKEGNREREREKERESETYSHTEQAGGVVLQREVLVGEGLGAVDGGAAGAVAVEEVAALDHEVGDLRVGSSRLD